MTKNAQSSDLERGIEALRCEKLDEARTLLRPLAEAGDAIAQYYLARATADLEESVRWCRRAIEGGSMDAVYELGRLYLSCDEDFGPTERAEALALLQRAARYFEKAAEAGDSRAQCRFGRMLVHGEGVEPNRASGLDWWRKGAASAGVGWQCALWTELWGEQEEYDAERAEAVQWAERAAEGGHAGAAYHLGAHYATGYEIPRDFAKAVYWYETAAKFGNTEAIYNLGVMHCTGEGLPKNCELGRKLLIEAAGKGDLLAISLLADAYRNPFWGFQKDDAEADYWGAEYERVAGELLPTPGEA